MGGTSDKLKGSAKETWGKATGDRSTQAEGTFDKAKGEVKHAGDELENKLRDDDRDRKADEKA